MKLAQALVERKGLKDEIKDLRRRLKRVAKVQEGDEPVEEPLKLLETIKLKVDKLQELITRINLTNINAHLSNGQTLMEAIAERDMLLLQRSALENLIEAATPQHDRFSRKEIRYIPTVNVTDIQKRADQVSKRYRELDSEIQALNWEMELE